MYETESSHINSVPSFFQSTEELQAESRYYTQSDISFFPCYFMFFEISTHFMVSVHKSNKKKKIPFGDFKSIKVKELPALITHASHLFKKIRVDTIKCVKDLILIKNCAII